MKIHEYQAKQLLKKFGVPIAAGQIAYTADAAREAARSIPGSVWAVKAQIHAGGRGKGGGIRIAKTLDEVGAYAEKMIGKPLITPQTGPNGQMVHRVYIEEGTVFDRELYVSLLLDRASGRLTFVASAEGGMDIEEVAAKSPHKIMTMPIDSAVGLCSFHSRKMAAFLNLTGESATSFAGLLRGVYDAYTQLDATLIEINPLAVLKNGSVLCLDAKMTFDDNGLVRQGDLESLRDLDEEDKTEIEAARHSLSYIKLDGNIGCLVNGAGLAMATMDVIKLYGGEPANFLDVGGGAPKERVAEAFRLILSDPHVEGILVNIFGGIMRCDIIADGIVAAARDVGMHVPLVVRLEGTNAVQGKTILANSGLAITPAADLGDAARLIVAAVREANHVHSN